MSENRDADGFRRFMVEHLARCVGLSVEEFETPSVPAVPEMESSAARMIRATGCGLPRERKAPAGELPAVASFWS
ncbi:MULTISPECIES: hypothetical protein [Methylobacterium]|uniref:Uncharacterized protein n=2 Tax=Methylobacterium TaxID=407 RepID=A0A2U8VS95_9HYPH|nr:MULTISPECIES: hypothetical protein [Methylobacterium]AWN36593.1 hypothetical protein DK427_13335 [Methylobacterium radiodurans]GJD55065.1 hypothetical protein IFDJLNFL_0947 [Methylobacterium dankookense]SFF87954.1 hypothetical protein SAMN04487844_1659 [Methylobacterium sp. yr596]VUF12063.1 hypothetical protein MTDSW087_01751 [Methylobacterium dankookense]